MLGGVYYWPSRPYKPVSIGLGVLGFGSDSKSTLYLFSVRRFIDASQKRLSNPKWHIPLSLIPCKKPYEDHPTKSYRNRQTYILFPVSSASSCPPEALVSEGLRGSNLSKWFWGRPFSGLLWFWV